MTRAKLAILLALLVLMIVPAILAQAQEAEPAGTAVIWDNLALSDAITYTITGAIAPATGRAYEGWLVSDDGSEKLSTGVMTVAADGSVDHTYTSPTGRNLIHEFDKVVITDEPVPDADPDPSGIFVYSHAIPGADGGGMFHIRHLLTNWPPGAPKGILTNLKEQLATAILHAKLASDSTTLENVQLHAHHVINIIEGEGGPNYDVAFGDPGDGIGVLAHAQDRKHGPFAAGAAADDPVIVLHAGLVDVTGKNAEDWATQARDQALVSLSSSSILNAKIHLIPVSGLLNNALNGADTDGDGTIESIAGEGGAVQAYVEAQLMATYTLEPGGLPAPPVPEVEPAPGLPSVGDSSVPTLAWSGLIAGLVLVGVGGLVVVRGRRSRA